MLNDRDRQQLEEAGIGIEEAERQLALLRGPARYVDLVRPCTRGDGIQVIEDSERAGLLELHASSAAAGRCSKFVPASGAATRMFRELLHFQRGRGRESTPAEIEREAEAGGVEARAVLELLRRLPELPFYESLRRALFRQGENLEGLLRVGMFQPVLDALLDSDGLDLANLPKGLIEFHTYPNGPRTAFEEHLVEACDYVLDGDGTVRVSFTVSPEHRRAFERRFEEVRGKYERPGQVCFEVGWSAQRPRTDTLAIDADGSPLRDAEGRLRLRPGGHGALIANLGELGGDVVFIKNIDNVQPDRVRPLASEWKRLACGLLLRVQAELFDHLRELRKNEDSGAVVERAERWAASTLHVSFDQGPSRSIEDRRARWIERLERPLRVCGVVRNTGEPGGGPYWVRGSDGTISLQIVESAQVDRSDADQLRIFRSSTHFNPVDLVCGLRGADGSPFALERFVDPEAVIVTQKSEGGRDVRVLERPGLWNGAMAHWNTVFLEMPIETFTPVKTVLDLLRPEHEAS